MSSDVRNTYEICMPRIEKKKKKRFNVSCDNSPCRRLPASRSASEKNICLSNQPWFPRDLNKIPSCSNPPLLPVPIRMKRDTGIPRTLLAVLKSRNYSQLYTTIFLFLLVCLFFARVFPRWRCAGSSSREVRRCKSSFYQQVRSVATNRSRETSSVQERLSTEMDSANGLVAPSPNSISKKLYLHTHTLYIVFFENIDERRDNFDTRFDGCA